MSQAYSPNDRSKRPLDAARLDELALAYVARFATSRGKLARYLSRKVQESKWIDAQESDDAIAAAVAKMERLKYLDDQQYAQLKGDAMMRRGLGPQRVRAQLRFDGVADGDSQIALANSNDNALSALVRFAQRRRFGPFAAEKVEDMAKRDKQLAAFIRAGHGAALARRLLAMEPIEHPDAQDIADWLAEN